MLTRLGEPDVGAVGALLTWPGDVVQHGGVVLGMNFSVAHAFTDRFSDDPGFLDQLLVAHECSAVTAACLATRRNDYLAVCGMDEGRFAVAIPEAGDYLVVTTADGWRPRSRIMHLDNTAPLPPIALRDRLTLAGTVTDAAGDPVVDALVVLTRHSGEVVGSLRTDHEGRYAMPRPSNGRYVVTVAAREGQMGARAITVLDTARDIDLTLGTPLGADAAYVEKSHATDSPRDQPHEVPVERGLEPGVEPPEDFRVMGDRSTSVDP